MYVSGGNGRNKVWERWLGLLCQYLFGCLVENNVNENLL